jgi:hypothetical protein
MHCQASGKAGQLAAHITTHRARRLGKKKPWPAQERRQSRRVYVFPAFQALVALAGAEKRKTNYGDVLADCLF